MATVWTARGVGIAIIDSGIYESRDLTKARTAPTREIYSEDFVDRQQPPFKDDYGHGTHVAGVAAGDGYALSSGVYTGMAPNATLLDLRVLDQNGSGTDSAVIVAIDRAIELKDTYNVRVINLSLGRGIFESYELDPLCQAVEAAYDAGIVVVVFGRKLRSRRYRRPRRLRHDHVTRKRSVRDHGRRDEDDGELST